MRKWETEEECTKTRASKEAGKQGILIPAADVRGVWQRHTFEVFDKRGGTCANITCVHALYALLSETTGQIRQTA